MEMSYMDDKQWKLSSSRNGSRRSAVAPAADEGSPRSLKGLKGRRRASRDPARSSSVSGRLASMVKEQRARFYIMRRCVTMLVCWRD